jgi:hypothetical protein
MTASFYDFRGGVRRSLAAIVTRSARESAFIFRIIWPRCAFTVIALMPRLQEWKRWAARIG